MCGKLQDQVTTCFKPSKTAVKRDSNVAVLVRLVHHFDTAIKDKRQKNKKKKKNLS